MLSGVSMRRDIKPISKLAYSVDIVPGAVEFSEGVRALTRRIKARATALGFDLVGISPVQAPTHGEAFSEWLRRGYQGEMGYMSRTAGERMSPGDFLPWARSVVSVGLNYNTPCSRGAEAERLRGWISRYAWGNDYHDVMQAKLADLLDSVCQEAGPGVQGRVFADAGPLMDREIGVRAGIGWYGKSTNLLSARIGSFFFLGELFLSVELEWDRPIRDRCGQCRLCLDACPTKAFVGPFVLDARRCISYLTVELRGAIPRVLRSLIGVHVFGCDICQDVCPYNTKVRATKEPAFRPRQGLHEPELIPLLSLTEAEFREKFAGSPILRARRRGLLRNVCVALGNLKRAEAVPALTATLEKDFDPLVRGHAAWALGQVRTREGERVLHEARAREADSTVQEEIQSSIDAFV